MANMDKAEGAEVDTQPNAALKWLVYAAQFFFGGWFLVHGLNHWMHFFTQPPGSSPISHELISALIDSGLFTVVKGLEVLTGIMLLANRFVPLAIVLAFPVAISIAYLDLIANPDLFGTVTAVVIMTLISVMALGHLDKYLPMLRMNQGDPSELGLRRLFQGKAD